MGFGKVLARILLIILPIFLFIWLIRLANDKDNYFGVSAFVNYFKNIQFTKYYQQIFTDFNNVIETYKQNAFAIITANASGNIFQMIAEIFGLLGNTIKVIFVFPLQILYDIIVFIVNVIGEIINFGIYIINY